IRIPLSMIPPKFIDRIIFMNNGEKKTYSRFYINVMWKKREMDSMKICCARLLFYILRRRKRTARFLSYLYLRRRAMLPKDIANSIISEAFKSYCLGLTN